MSLRGQARQIHMVVALHDAVDTSQARNQGRAPYDEARVAAKFGDEAAAEWAKMRAAAVAFRKIAAERLHG